MTRRPSRLWTLFAAAMMIAAFWAPTKHLSRFAPVAYAGRLCVEPGGTGSCYPTIGEALAAANAGDVIWVAEGTYRETLTLDKTVILLGSWNSIFTERDPAEFPSVIQPANAGNSVVSIVGQQANWNAVAPTLDGFTLTGGRSSKGGGLRMLASNATIRNNIIVGNVSLFAGGGVEVYEGAPVFENNRIANNIVERGGFGGGIELESSQATLRNNVILQNEVRGTNDTFGGGINITGGGPIVLEANSVISNTANAEGTSGGGGGVAMQEVSVTLRGNTIRGNLASVDTAGEGGGLYARQSVLLLQGDTIEDNIVSEGQGGPGGGIFALNSQISLDAVRLLGNRTNPDTAGEGGGAFLDTSPYTMTNTLVAGNESPNVGGLYTRLSPGRLMHVTLADNMGVGIRTDANLAITNSIIVGHAVGIQRATASGAGATIGVTFSDFFGNTTNAAAFTLNHATNLFVNPILDGTYHLLSNSPLIDAGTNAGAPDHDIDGDIRPRTGTTGQTRVDIGADESTAVATPTPMPTASPSRTPTATPPTPSPTRTHTPSPTRTPTPPSTPVSDFFTLHLPLVSR